MQAIELRTARPEDRDFLLSLSPRLSGVPGPLWHDLKAMEGFPVSFAFPEDSNPGQACLGAFKHQKFKQGFVVGNGFAPFFVMVFYI